MNRKLEILIYIAWVLQENLVNLKSDKPIVYYAKEL
jgi:hypothetical protein